MLCIVANTRAGTTALQSALAGTEKFANMGESSQPSERPGCYITFLRNSGMLACDLLTYEQVSEAAESYYEFLHREAAGRIPLIDVKFNSWGAFRPLFQYTHNAPFFMSFLRKKNACFLFILREDLAAQILSEKIAREAEKWHNLKAEDVMQPIAVDVDAVRHQARMIVQSENFLSSQFGKQYPHWTHVTYEKLYDDGAVAADIVEWIERHGNVVLPRPLRPAIEKNLVEKRAAILNYDEAVAAVDAVVKHMPRKLLARVNAGRVA